MKKTLLLFGLLLFSANLFAQQFSLYDTETLFDSFENPAQRSIIRDSSNMYAFNFFMPNGGVNTSVHGNANATLQNRLFSPNKWDNRNLEIGQGKFNYTTANANIYLIMFKVFTNLKGNQELGFSLKIKGEGTAAVTDETIGILDGNDLFKAGDVYNNIFNSKGYYQTYHQLGFSYREDVTNRLALGVKLNLLLGMSYQKLQIHESNIAFNNPDTSALLKLRATYYRSYTPGKLSWQDMIPSTRHPGASISLGASYKSERGVVWQFNVKDLGFIHWSNSSRIYYANDTTTLHPLAGEFKEDSIRLQSVKLLNSGLVKVGSFTTPTNGIIEIGATKRYWLNDMHTLRLSPSIIMQKQLFFPGYIGALVAHLQYNKIIITGTTSYDDTRLLNIGGQFMYKTPNFEVFAGSESLLQTARAAVGSPNFGGQYAAGSIFIGLSAKFGAAVESNMNASHIPMGEKGFLGRFWSRLFKTNR
ncbi:MAG: hypothetical protein EOP47_26345 [Sphingobacteriaceae bacterium]|nr:MAG: hypothetical protein EOP47_26345 [Sphingobacteriaceae bacterium]